MIVESETEDDVKHFSKTSADGDKEKGEAVESQLGKKLTAQFERFKLCLSVLSGKTRKQPFCCHVAGLYDSLLKGRIEVQKILAAANQLPQPDKWNEFIDSAGDDYRLAVKEGSFCFL